MKPPFSSILLFLALPPLSSGAAESAPDFATEVRPILSGSCFKCHGPDDAARKGSIRFDSRAGALAEGKSGERGIVPGRPDLSEAITRVFSDSSDDVMPPTETKHPLTAAQKDILRRWVAAGAEYKEHWAFQKPVQAPVPDNGAGHPVDAFVNAKLASAGIPARPDADRVTLIRRVSLDLIGLPPSPEEADAFAADPAPDAYEKLVDRLLASPRYGERWARRWLDLARYADTNGFEKDRTRSIWPFRDWVVQALNADMPYDTFTVDQLAGDMLPNATPEARVATGFNRNTMLNEEGGIDPLEFRYAAMVDRVHATSTAWMGLTMACAQCHTHKYDPITHTEYFSFMAFLDNADEPEMAIPDKTLESRRAAIEAKALAREASLAEEFPPREDTTWEPLAVSAAEARHGTALAASPDGTVTASGPLPEIEVHTLRLRVPAGAPVTEFRLSALADDALPSRGPGRTAHGNFVLTEFQAERESTAGAPQPLAIAAASADFSQTGFPPDHAFDGNAGTGWAIHGDGNWNVDRHITFRLSEPLTLTADAEITVRLHQGYGSGHTLGKYRIEAGRRSGGESSATLAQRRAENLEARFQEWIAAERADAVKWSTLKPEKASSAVPVMRVLPDNSVLSTSDTTKSDLIQVEASSAVRGVTAVRLEALPDESLPAGGPGRVYYEGAPGDFFLSSFRLFANGAPVALAGATQSFADGNNDAAKMLDGDQQSGWSINGGQGKRHVAVFRLKEPLADASRLKADLLCEKYYAAGIGRFRLSVTDDPRAGAAREHPAEVEELLTRSAPWTPAETAEARARFLEVAPELAGARAEIVGLRASKPALTTTLVMTERPADNPRITRRHHRGEFLQPEEEVKPGVPAFLPPLPEGAPANRLTLARWLVSRDNPLTARVAVNRQWQAFFGKGLVKTMEDFGYQGAPPTHPELLDWLAVEFMNDGWSMKKLHRLLVTSAAYRRDSRATPDLLEQDPQNLLLARGPRHRVEAEMVRDIILKSAGLLSVKSGGPGVFPPQPAGVTTEGAYGALQWKVSEGEDRYRRGLYTFAKRTAPYAMSSGFDAPSGEACVARRDVSNTPLQALTLLNDTVIVEAAQALGRAAAEKNGASDAAVEWMFRQTLTRQPDAEELATLKAFFAAQEARIKSGELDAAVIAGAGSADPARAAALVLTARALFNLDETIVKS